MRYWDSSALIPLFIAESGSAHTREIQAQDPAIITWWGTPVECVSAFARLERGGSLTASQMREAIMRMRRAQIAWTEVEASEEVREHAMRMLRVHSLRAGDAMQLGAATVAAQFQANSLEFVTLDRNQKAAAEKEGFRIVN